MTYKVEHLVFDTFIEAENSTIPTIKTVGDLFIASNYYIEYRYSTLLEAEAKILEIQEIEYTVLEIPSAVINYEKKYYEDVAFGKLLIETFLIDNRKHLNVTVAQSMALLSKFASIDALCQKGDINSVEALLPSVAIDEVYTQIRKDKYMSMINKYKTS